jgi:hypothetical protein
MQEKEYQEFLKTAPEDHFSDEFIQFLRDNNEVVEETVNWLIIKNCKDPNDYTAFWKMDCYRNYTLFAYSKLMQLLKEYGDREWVIKAPHKRSVKLFHVHLIKKH